MASVERAVLRRDLHRAPASISSPRSSTPASRNARSRFRFSSRIGQTTPRGVFRLGVQQGLYCLGCCWAMMLVMFAVGVMNVIWMAALGIVMTLEKIGSGRRFTYGVGAALDRRSASPLCCRRLPPIGRRTRFELGTRKAGSETLTEAWTLKGELALSCSCTVFCPCVLSLGDHPPTEERCQTWAGIRIDERAFRRRSIFPASRSG